MKEYNMNENTIHQLENRLDEMKSKVNEYIDENTKLKEALNEQERKLCALENKLEESQSKVYNYTKRMMRIYNECVIDEGRD